MSDIIYIFLLLWVNFTEEHTGGTSNITQPKTCVSKGNNVKSDIASKIFFYQVGKVLSLMLFMFHYYHVVALFLLGKDVEEGEQPAETDEEAEVGVQLVPAACAVHEHKRPLLPICWNSVFFFWLGPRPLRSFPIYRPRAVYRHRNGQLADHWI